jgi:hypothetical protein
MAKGITKVSDKLTKVGEFVNVYFYDNAYMVEVSGRNKEDDWVSVKLVCRDLNEVQAVLEEVDSLPKDS